MKLKILPLLFLLITSLPASAQKATLSGVVLDENNVPLPHANIFIMENNRGTTSNLDGEFHLTLDPGKFTIVIRYMGYKTVKEKITFRPDQKYHRKFVLTGTAIQLGEITVVAEDEFIPLAPETKSVIQSGEIEHIQATSLNDVLQLIPGEKTTNPTLHSSAEARIRRGNSLGTQVIMDGVPLSNNANMQIGIGSTSGNSGIDLRAIPAENIQEVEVIRGIPSAQHGDLIDGIMIVKTKSRQEPLRMKFKYNPHLYETNISGGMLVKNWAVNGNFNVALAQRDIRVEGDGYTRIAAQVSANRETNRYNLKNLLYYTRTFDESKEKPGYALREAWYNRDFRYCLFQRTEVSNQLWWFGTHWQWKCRSKRIDKIK